MREIEYAIVGGGVAGTYAAWRLSRAGRQDVHLFEMDKRIGGRTYSAVMPGLGGIRRAELGAMRYLTSQPVITDLVRHLRRSLNDPGFDTLPFEVDFRNNIHYLRGRHLTREDLLNAEKLPYRLPASEAGRSPGELLLFALNQIVPEAAYLSPAEWKRVQRELLVDGEHLYNLGLWNLLQKVLTSEGYKYLRDTHGYDTTVSNWNAADALPWTMMDFAPTTTYASIRAGFQHLPSALIQQARESGVRLEKKQLTRWEPRADGSVLMFFNHESTASFVARNLILAVPRRALTDIEMPHDKKVEKLIHSVTPRPLFKFFLAYGEAWWRVMGLKFGRSITDLPLQQVYYWGSNADGFFPDMPAASGGVANAPGHSMIMASYSDGSENDYWGGLTARLQGRPFGMLRLDLDQKRDDEHRSAVGNMVATVQEQLRELHGLAYIPEPYAISYADWSAYPYGGGWNSWKVGEKSWEVMRRIRKPYKHSNVFICGECYSSYQGWVEGALETAELVLTRNLNDPLEKPDWLSVHPEP